MSDAGGDFGDDFSDDGDFFELDDEELIDDIDDDSVDGDEEDEFRFIDLNETKPQIHQRDINLTNMRSGAEFRRIPDEKRTTRNVMDRYEFAKCLSTRTQQIANGSEPLIVVPKGVTDSDRIAYLELMEKKTPFILVRKVPHVDLVEVEEWWSVAELIIPQNDY